MSDDYNRGWHDATGYLLLDNERRSWRAGFAAGLVVAAGTVVVALIAVAVLRGHP